MRGTELKNSKRGVVCAVLLDKISTSTRDIVGWKDEGKFILAGVLVFDKLAKLIIRVLARNFVTLMKFFIYLLNNRVDKESRTMVS